MYRVAVTVDEDDNETAARLAASDEGGAAASGPPPIEGLADLDHRSADADEVVAFPDEAAAETAARRCSDLGDVPVRLQAPAPQDPRDVDAYLVADPERRVRDPDGSLDAGLTFDTGANQYGALGEALVTTPAGNPPPLTAYVRRTGEGDDPHVDVDPDPEPIRFRSRETGDLVAWHPDCVARVRPRASPATGSDAPRSPRRRLLCEVKTGAGSTERDQRRAMRWAAADRAGERDEVLIVRVDVSGLPDEYGVRFQRVEPTEPPAEWVADSGGDHSLSEFR